MDALTYLAAKAEGKASIISHGDETILVSLPGGFDPSTGQALPPKETGYQRADIYAMREAAIQAVAHAEAALDEAKRRAAAFEEVASEVDAIVEAAKA
jgi:hypothetical protein